jgi:hypothetical protein
LFKIFLPSWSLSFFYHQHLVFISQQLTVRSWTHCYCRFKRLSCIVEELIKLAGVLNTVVSLDFDKSLVVELPFLFSQQVFFSFLVLAYINLLQCCPNHKKKPYLKKSIFLLLHIRNLHYISFKNLK